MHTRSFRTRRTPYVPRPAPGPARPLDFSLVPSPTHWTRGSKGALVRTVSCTVVLCILIQVDEMNGGSEDRAGGITGRLSSLWNTSTDKDDTCVTWGLVSRGLFSYYTIKGWIVTILLKGG